MVLCIMRVCTVKAIQHTCIVFRPQVSLEWTCVACAENGFDILHFDPHSFQCSRLQTPGPKRHVGHHYPGPLPVKRFDLEQGQMIDIAGRFNIFNFKCSHELCSCFCHHYTGCEKTNQKKCEKSFPLPSERFIFGMTFIICKWIAVSLWHKTSMKSSEFGTERPSLSRTFQQPKCSRALSQGPCKESEEWILQSVWFKLAGRRGQWIHTCLNAGRTHVLFLMLKTASVMRRSRMNLVHFSIVLDQSHSPFLDGVPAKNRCYAQGCSDPLMTSYESSLSSTCVLSTCWLLDEVVGLFIFKKV